MPNLSDLFSAGGFLKWDGAGNADADYSSQTPAQLAADAAFTGAFGPVRVAAPTGVAATDTAVLQAAITAAVASGGGREVVLRPGTYVINDPLIIAPPAYSGVTIRGAGRPSRDLSGEFTFIRQDGGDEPVIKFTTTGATNCHLSDFGVGYSAASGTGNTARVGFLFDGDAAGNNATWFENTFERLSVLNAYGAWKLGTAAAESATVWGTTWADILIADVQHHCWDLVASSVAGQPVNSFRDIYVNNASGTVTATGKVFNFAAVEATMSGLDIEGWVNRVYTNSGGGNVTIAGVHVEWHEIDGTTTESPLFYQATGHLAVRNLTVSGTSLGGQFGITALANAGTDGVITLEDLIVSWSSVTGDNCIVQGSDGDYRIGSHQLGAGMVAYDVAYNSAALAKVKHLAASGPSLIHPPGLLGTAGALAWEANMALAFRLPRVPVDTQFRYALFQVGTASGNIQVAVHELSGTGLTDYTRVVNSGSIACPASGHIRLDLGNFTLAAGKDYAISFWADNATVTVAWQGSRTDMQTLRASWYLGTPAGAVGASGSLGSPSSAAMNIGLEGDI